MARFIRLEVYGSVSQRTDPAVQAVDGLRDRRSADPVADGAPDVGIAAQIQRVDLADGRFPGEQLVHVDDVRRDLVHQAVAGVDVLRVQVCGQDVRPHVDGPAVAGVPLRDLLRCRRHLCGRDIARQVHVQLVVIVIARLDHQVADRGPQHLRVSHCQARQV